VNVIGQRVLRREDRPTLAFGREPSTSSARRVLRASLVYLPGLLLVLLLDRSVAALLSGK